MNHKKHDSKVTNLNLIFIWSILAPSIFCNIPYFLAKFLREKAVNSRAGSPIVGGNFVTCLEKSLGIFMSGMVRELTCIKGYDISMNYLESMRLVVNLKGMYGILVNEEERPN